MKEKNRNEKDRKEKSLFREMINWILCIVVILLLVVAVVQFIGQGTKVSGSSMRPTLEDGDNLVVDKISYRFRNPSRFDVVVFPFQYKEDTYYIKRIIGLPGETVQIADGLIYINGSVLEENFGNEKIQKAGLAYEPITLGEDEYFVLGDNRNNSSDSREPSVGNIRRASITGKALFRIWPLNRFGIVQ